MSTQEFLVGSAVLASETPRNPQSVARVQPLTTQRFEWTMGAYMVLLCLGSSLDNWAHFHGKVDQSFFTPWHAVLYGMMALMGTVLGPTAFSNRKKGFAWQRSLPQGYVVSLLGVGLFIVAGLIDLCWHLMFGIEFDTAAYISPPHLFLLTSGILAGTGPVRSAWYRLTPSTARGWRTLGPMLLSAASAVAALAMFTVFASPMVDTFAAKNPHQVTMAFTNMVYTNSGATNGMGHGDMSSFEQALGVAEVIVQTVLLMSFTLLLLRIWRLPFGSLTLLIAFPSALQALMADNYWLIAGATITGLMADLIVRRLRSPLAGRALYIVGASVPAIYVATMFTTFWLTVGTDWPATLLVGTTIYAAVTGLLLAFLLDWPLRHRDQAV